MTASTKVTVAAQDASLAQEGSERKSMRVALWDIVMLPTAEKGVRDIREFGPSMQAGLP
jgi:hypothetical protein